MLQDNPNSLEVSIPICVHHVRTALLFHNTIRHVQLKHWVMVINPLYHCPLTAAYTLHTGGLG